VDLVAAAGVLPVCWAQVAGAPAISAGQWLAWAAWLLVGFFGVFPGIVAYIVWAERKVAGRFQDRIGPNRVGPFGLLQPIADFLKLITKENTVPAAADRPVHLLAPVILLVSAFLVLAVVPFGFGRLVDGRLTGFLPVDLPAGLLYIVAVSSLSSLGVFLAGWSSRNKYSLLGAMRGVAQLVSYEVPQVLATVPILLWTGSLSLVAIMDRQAASGIWNLFTPSGFLAFGLLTISSIAEVNRTPFDLPEAESEIIAGYHTEYSGMRFGLFFLAEYLSVFGISCLGTVLFLGGGSLPFLTFPRGLLDGAGTPLILLVNFFTVGVFFAKVVLYIFVIFWIRATLPRLRVDQLMNFAWKTLIPLSLANILIAAVWYECAIRPGGPGWIVGFVVTAALVALALYGVSRLNRGLRTLPAAGRAVTPPSLRASVAAAVAPSR
jgi:NADH-quinone oxidoreductase subunit H